MSLPMAGGGTRGHFKSLPTQIILWIYDSFFSSLTYLCTYVSLKDYISSFFLQFQQEIRVISIKRWERKAGPPARRGCSPSSVNLHGFTHWGYDLDTKDQTWWRSFTTIDDESKAFCLLPFRIHTVRMSFLPSEGVREGEKRDFTGSWLAGAGAAACVCVS